VWLAHRGPRGLASATSSRAQGHAVESIGRVLREQACLTAARTYRAWRRGRPPNLSEQCWIRLGHTEVLRRRDPSEEAQQPEPVERGPDDLLVRGLYVRDQPDGERLR
jgi:hypothetical protein